MSTSRGKAEALLERIEWTVMRRLDGLFQGDYHSLFRGTGLDLADLREYQPNDDVRYIDWNVTARLQTPYVREYHEDREVSALFVVDLSPSIEVSWSTTRKRTVAVEFTVLLARLLTRRGNRAGAFIFDGTGTRPVPAGSSRDHVLFLTSLLTRRPPTVDAPPTDLGRVLRDVARGTTRRSLVFVVSDFVSSGDWARELGELARRHEVIGVRIVDPADRELPDLGIVAMQDAETNEQIVVDTHSRGFRKSFAEIVERNEAAVQAGFAQAGVDALELLTTDDLIDAVMRFAELRRARQRVAGAVG
jgi:uncharacterized protein (DUF58 family)